MEEKPIYHSLLTGDVFESELQDAQLVELRASMRAIRVQFWASVVCWVVSVAAVYRTDFGWAVLFLAMALVTAMLWYSFKESLERSVLEGRQNQAPLREPENAPSDLIAGGH